MTESELLPEESRREEKRQDAGEAKRKKLRLNPRLAACQAACPPRYPRLLDIACDHALLSIAELQRTGACQALASDIAAGPLKRAEAAVRKYHMQSRVELRQGAGFSGIEFRRGDVAVVAGLGGLEISDMIKALPLLGSEEYLSADLRACHAEPSEGGRKHAKKTNPCQAELYRDVPLLIVQAMKSWEVLRLTLAAAGFDLLTETIAEQNGHLYPINCYRFPIQPPSTRALPQHLLPDFLDPGEEKEMREVRKALGLRFSDLYFGPILQKKLPILKEKILRQKRRFSDRLATKLPDATIETAEEKWLLRRLILLNQIVSHGGFIPGLGCPQRSELSGEISELIQIMEDL